MKPMADSVERSIRVLDLVKRAHFPYYNSTKDHAIRSLYGQRISALGHHIAKAIAIGVEKMGLTDELKHKMSTRFYSPCPKERS